MAEIRVPKKDANPEKRKSEVLALAGQYTYNREIGIPLVETERELDRNKPDWTAKIFAVFLINRSNLWRCYERFEWNYPKQKRDLFKLAGILRNNGDVNEYFTPDYGFIRGGKSKSRAKSFQDFVDNVFLMRAIDKGPVFSPLPDIEKVWDKDKTFAYNFVAGPNPNQLERYRPGQGPKNLKLENLSIKSIKTDDGEMPFANDSIINAINSGRVYFVDRSDLAKYFFRADKGMAKNATIRKFRQAVSDDLKYTYAPTAAFAVPPGGSHLYPIAIRCGLREEGHEIYTPNDGYSWKMAKVCMLASHNNHHEVVSHLGLTHLLIDPIVAATRRNLHVTHPVHRLLTPHFEGTVPVNIGARTTLIKPEKSVDRLVGSQIDLNYPYLKDTRLAYNFWDNRLPQRLERLGTLDAQLLPNYPYREDGLLVWNAIRAWVADYISVWYATREEVQTDYELQAWAREVENQTTGGMVKNFTKTGGGINDLDELIEILTKIIFTAGPQHAAVNFTQGEEMIFVPANPMAGYAPEPRGRNHTEKDYLEIFPPMDVAIQTWNILSLLAGVNNTRLGSYRRMFLGNPVTLAYEVEFKARLYSVERKINEANKIRRNIFGLEYIHLLPSRIPASINI